MFSDLRENALRANLELTSRGLVASTFGNVSVIDPVNSVVAIKPSGIPYGKMTKDDIVVVDLEGSTVFGDRRPSSDTLTHLELYRRLPSIGAIVHTHSIYATIWAQAGLSIPPLGTTHADYFSAEVPVSRHLTEQEINGNYLASTAAVIIELVGDSDPYLVPAALVRSHGPFCWGRDGEDAVNNADMLELSAKLAFKTLQLEQDAKPMGSALHRLHFERKHGAHATYGQVNQAGN